MKFVSGRLPTQHPIGMRPFQGPCMNTQKHWIAPARLLVYLSMTINTNETKTLLEKFLDIVVKIHL